MEFAKKMMLLAVPTLVSKGAFIDFQRPESLLRYGTAVSAQLKWGIMFE